MNIFWSHKNDHIANESCLVHTKCFQYNFAVAFKFDKDVHCRMEELLHHN